MPVANISYLTFMSAIIAAALTLVGNLGGNFLTQYMTFKRELRLRIWNRKYEVYVGALSAIQQIKILQEQKLDIESRINTANKQLGKLRNSLEHALDDKKIESIKETIQDFRSMLNENIKLLGDISSQLTSERFKILFWGNRIVIEGNPDIHSAYLRIPDSGNSGAEEYSIRLSYFTYLVTQDLNSTGAGIVFRTLSSKQGTFTEEELRASVAELKSDPSPKTQDV